MTLLKSVKEDGANEKRNAHQKKASVRKQMLSKTKMMHDSVVKTPPGISSFCWEIVMKFLCAVVDFATFLAVRGVPDERPPSPLRSVEKHRDDCGGCRSSSVWCL